MNQYYCIHCGRALQEEAQFCSRCGKPVQAVPGYPGPMEHAEQEVPKKKHHAMALVGFILGVVSILVYVATLVIDLLALPWEIGVSALVPAVVAVVFGILGLKKEKSWMCFTGLSCGGLVVLLVAAQEIIVALSDYVAGSAV